MDRTPDAELHDSPPDAAEPTDYDWAHRICYLRLLDAEAEGTDWRDVARVVMRLDPDRNPQRVHAAWKKPSRTGEMDDDERLPCLFDRAGSAKLTVKI